MEYLGIEKPVNQLAPEVTICVPTFQHVKYIAECLESVLAQKTNFPIEIIIGEDDSTDGTREICKTYADKYPDKIRLLLRDGSKKVLLYGKKSGRLNHLGLYGSARGKYICICDGDDYWSDNNKLQLQYDAMKAEPSASLCITDTFISGQEESRAVGLPQQYRVFSPRELRKVIYMGHISSWMIKNEMDVLLKSNITTKSISMDNVLFNFYKLRGRTIFLPQLTSVYRLNPNGIYRSQSSKTNHKRHFQHNWYLFYYIHHDTVQLIRSMAYAAKRYYVLFIK